MAIRPRIEKAAYLYGLLREAEPLRKFFWPALSNAGLESRRSIGTIADITTQDCQTLDVAMTMLWLPVRQAAAARAPVPEPRTDISAGKLGRRDPQSSVKTA